MFRKEENPAIIFHGSHQELKPEDFDFDLADKDSDFGKAMYFGFEYDQAHKWTVREETVSSTTTCSRSMRSSMIPIPRPSFWKINCNGWTRYSPSWMSLTPVLQIS